MKANDWIVIRLSCYEELLDRMSHWPRLTKAQRDEVYSLRRQIADDRHHLTEAAV